MLEVIKKAMEKVGGKMDSRFFMVHAAKGCNSRRRTASGVTKQEAYPEFLRLYTEGSLLYKLGSDLVEEVRAGCPAAFRSDAAVSAVVLVLLMARAPRFVGGLVSWNNSGLGNFPEWEELADLVGKAVGNRGLSDRQLIREGEILNVGGGKKPAPAPAPAPKPAPKTEMDQEIERMRMELSLDADLTEGLAVPVHARTAPNPTPAPAPKPKPRTRARRTRKVAAKE